MPEASSAKQSEPIAVVPGLAAIADRYDGFILDLWGTLHDGYRPLPGAIEALERLRRAGKRVLVLSNAPRRSHSVIERMSAIGIPKDLYDAVLSSGEAANAALRARADAWHAALGDRAYVIGGPDDDSTLEETGIERVEDVAEASFILAVGPERPGQSVADFEAPLRAGAARGLKLLCANPDLEVLRGDKREICAGALAARYAQLGGDVFHHGKPHPPIYATTLELLETSGRGDVLAIGDSLATDIAGANMAGIDSLLVTGGIHAEALGISDLGAPDPARLAAFCDTAGVRPGYAIARFMW